MYIYDTRFSFHFFLPAKQMKHEQSNFHVIVCRHLRLLSLRLFFAICYCRILLFRLNKHAQFTHHHYHYHRHQPYTSHTIQSLQIMDNVQIVFHIYMENCNKQQLRQNMRCAHYQNQYRIRVHSLTHTHTPYISAMVFSVASPCQKAGEHKQHHFNINTSSNAKKQKQKRKKSIFVRLCM